MEIEFNEGGPFGEMLSGAIRGAMCNRVLFVCPIIIRGWGRGEEDERGGGGGLEGNQLAGEVVGRFSVSNQGAGVLRDAPT